MAKIFPFKAVRPTRDKVALVASRAYQFYDEEGRNFRMARNPFSFLHIINPGYKYHQEISGQQRFTLVKNRYQEFKEDGIFLKDGQPSFYVYKMIDRENNTFCGMIAAASVQDYMDDVIKKHENTIAKREVLFKEYLNTVGFNAEAVLITYPDHSGVQNALAEIMKARPEYEFTTTYRDSHYMWPVSDHKTVTQLQNYFAEIPKLYIADGHHRSASSALLSKDYTSKDESYHSFMSFLIPESSLLIYEFNRLITDLNNLSKEEFLIALDTSFRIQNRGSKPYKPTKKHHFSMYLDGEFYSLYYRQSLRDFSSPLDQLDAQILLNTVLDPILGIKDPRDDERIDYEDGRKDILEVKEQVDNGTFAVSFGMLPVSINELKEIADAGLKMPPKSTYIEPKLRSGITVYEF